jgi:hypothetical protein
MMSRRTTYQLLAILLAALATGCEDNDARVARMAEQYAERQAEQSQQMVELQREVAKGTRQLVEADAQARKEIAVLQREVGRQQNQLEADRRAISAQRHRDPIIAAAITNVGLLLACLLPLVLCWYLLRPCPVENIEADVNEILLREITSQQPLLLPPPHSQRSLPIRDESETRCKSNNSTLDDDASEATC